METKEVRYPKRKRQQINYYDDADESDEMMHDGEEFSHSTKVSISQATASIYVFANFQIGGAIYPS
jgi:hypothetical protein